MKSHAFIKRNKSWTVMDALRNRCRLVLLNGRTWHVWCVSTEGGNLAQIFSKQPGQRVRYPVTDPIPIGEARAIVEWVLATQEAT